MEARELKAQIEQTKTLFDQEIEEKFSTYSTTESFKKLQTEENISKSEIYNNKEIHLGKNENLINELFIKKINEKVKEIETQLNNEALSSKTLEINQSIQDILSKIKDPTRQIGRLEGEVIIATRRGKSENADYIASLKAKITELKADLKKVDEEIKQILIKDEDLQHQVMSLLNKKLEFLMLELQDIKLNDYQTKLEFKLDEKIDQLREEIAILTAKPTVNTAETIKQQIKTTEEAIRDGKNKFSELSALQAQLLKLTPQINKEIENILSNIKNPTDQIQRLESEIQIRARREKSENADDIAALKAKITAIQTDLNKIDKLSAKSDPFEAQAKKPENLQPTSKPTAADLFNDIDELYKGLDL